LFTHKGKRLQAYVYYFEYPVAYYHEFLHYMVHPNSYSNENGVTYNTDTFFILFLYGFYCPKKKIKFKEVNISIIENNAVKTPNFRSI